MISSRSRRAARSLAPCLIPAILLALSASSAAPGGPDRPRSVEFEPTPGALRITIDGRPFARYVFRDDRIPRPFLEHVRTPGGVRVTRHNPPIEGEDLADHPTFHPGLWLAFGDLSGADVWRNRGRVEHVKFEDGPRATAPGRGSFAVRNRYEDEGGRAVAEERCRITILALPEGNLVLWDSWFTPSGDGPLVFGDQEEMGLGVRVASPMAAVRGGRIVNSRGQEGEAGAWGEIADWCAYLGEVEGDPVGILLMPDPGMFRPCWFHARDYGLLEANPFGRHAFTGGEPSRVVVPPGEALRLRFGVLFFDGRPDLEEAYRVFLHQIGAEDP